jgi:ribosomal protein S27E
MYLVCWNGSCAQTYPIEKYSVEDRNVQCEKCGDTLISNSGKVILSGLPQVFKTGNPDSLIEEDDEHGEE